MSTVFCATLYVDDGLLLCLCSSVRVYVHLKSCYHDIERLTEFEH